MTLFIETRAAKVPLDGLEVDNLLSFLALLGLLRALEERHPDWAPRASWSPAPWKACLHLADEDNQARIAEAADEGLRAVIDRLALVGPRDPDGQLLADVGFASDEYRSYASRTAGDPEAATFAACLACAWPPKKDGNLLAGPLVMMFGQGHQHFLTRYFAVPCAENGASSIARALFKPWARADEAQGFRWDPEDDQRYALRFGNPSKAGAASTEDGANRLATLGFLSFPVAPGSRRSTARGCVRGVEVSLVWPVWREPLSLAGIESLLSHPDVMAGDCARLGAFGVEEIYRARRVSNGKFMNVTRALPIAGGPASGMGGS